MRQIGAGSGPHNSLRKARPRTRIVSGYACRRGVILSTTPKFTSRRPDSGDAHPCGFQLFLRQGVSGCRKSGRRVDTLREVRLTKGAASLSSPASWTRIAELKIQLDALSEVMDADLSKIVGMRPQKLFGGADYEKVLWNRCCSGYGHGGS
jgi:hypothetical protein